MYQIRVRSHQSHPVFFARKLDMYTWSTPALIKWFGAFVCTYWLAFPAQARNAISTLCVFMVIDVLTGLWASGLHGQLDSGIGRRGVNKKLATIIFLLVVHSIERSGGIDLNLETVGALAYTVNESISIVENFAIIGVPIPAPLVAALFQAKKLRVHAATEEQLRQLQDTNPREDPKSNG